MTPEEIKRLVRRDPEEIWTEGNVEAIEDLFAPDFVLHDPTSPGEIRGREAYRETVETFREAFPDAEYTVEDVLAEGEMAALRYTARATHRGTFMGFEATGEQVTVSGMEMYRVRDGEIVELWTSYDALGLLQQLGVVASVNELG